MSSSNGPVRITVPIFLRVGGLGDIGEVGLGTVELTHGDGRSVLVTLASFLHEVADEMEKAGNDA